MLASISPLGERARGNRWSRTAAWYVAGSLAGGALLGAACGAIGALLRVTVAPSATALAVLVLASAGTATVMELGILGARVPSNHRQVDEDWLGKYRPWVYAGGFGLQLGLGVATIVTTATVYLVIVLAVLSGSVSTALLVGATFGLARALPIVVVRDVSDPGALRQVLRRVQSRAAVARRVALGALVGLAVLALVAAAG
jgi:hypothetical protein